MLSSKVQVLVKALVLLMLFSSAAISQDNTRTYGLIQKGKIVRQIDSDSKVLYATPEDNIVFGYYSLTSNSPKLIYRSIYEVALPQDLPAGALITKVELIYQNNGNYSGEKFAIYNIPISSYDKTWGEAKRWEITESGSLLQEYGVYGSSILTVGVATLQEIANEALQAGKTKLYLGFRAYPESGPYDTRNNNFSSLSIKFTYEIVVRHTINNSNGSGKIDVNIDNHGFSEVSSGDTLWLQVGSTVQLRAKEEQFDGSHYWVWNQDPNTLDATKSSWKIRNGEVTSSSDIQYSYLTKKEYLFSNFTADLKRSFCINRVDKTEFDGNFQTNDLIRVVEGNSTNVPCPQTLTKTSGTYSFVGWEDGEGSLRTPTDNTTYTALYKMPHKSETSTSFSNSSQRKFIRTPDGSLHLVYESMGLVWYERSSDGGNTWLLMNNGKPLSYNPSKSPSIDYCGNPMEGTIGIVFQEKSPNLWECYGKVKYYPVFYSDGVYGSSAPQDIEFLYDEDYDTLMLLQ